MPVIRPKVLIAPLCGVERGNWLNPVLAQSLIAMAQDKYFDVTIEPAFACNPADYARNTCVVAAREKKVDWLLMVDNDQLLPPNMLDILREAYPQTDVIGLYAGMSENGGASFVLNCIPTDERQGQFTRVSRIGAGVMALRHTVWEKLPRGPWFRTTRADDELLTIAQGEDYYFCDLARAAGLQLWMHRMGAGHLRTCDLTRLACNHK